MLSLSTILLHANCATCMKFHILLIPCSAMTVATAVIRKNNTPEPTMSKLTSIGQTSILMPFSTTISHINTTTPSVLTRPGTVVSIHKTAQISTPTVAGGGLFQTTNITTPTSTDGDNVTNTTTAPTTEGSNGNTIARTVTNKNAITAVTDAKGSPTNSIATSNRDTRTNAITPADNVTIAKGKNTAFSASTKSTSTRGNNVDTSAGIRTAKDTTITTVVKANTSSVTPAASAHTKTITRSATSNDAVTDFTTAVTPAPTTTPAINITTASAARNTVTSTKFSTDVFDITTTRQKTTATAVKANTTGFYITNVITTAVTDNINISDNTVSNNTNALITTAKDITVTAVTPANGTSKNIATSDNQSTKTITTSATYNTVTTPKDNTSINTNGNITNANVTTSSDNVAVTTSKSTVITATTMVDKTTKFSTKFVDITTTGQKTTATVVTGNTTTGNTSAFNTTNWIPDVNAIVTTRKATTKTLKPNVNAHTWQLVGQHA